MTYQQLTNKAQEIVNAANDDYDDALDAMAAITVPLFANDPNVDGNDVADALVSVAFACRRASLIADGKL